MIFLFLSSPTIHNKTHRSDYKRWYPRVQIVFETVKRTDNVRNTPFKNKKILLFVLKPIKKTATRRCVPADRQTKNANSSGSILSVLPAAAAEAVQLQRFEKPIRRRVHYGSRFPRYFPVNVTNLQRTPERTETSIQSLFRDEYKIPVELIGGRPFSFNTKTIKSHAFYRTGQIVNTLF